MLGRRSAAWPHLATEFPAVGRRFGAAAIRQHHQVVLDLLLPRLVVPLGMVRHLAGMKRGCRYKMIAVFEMMDFVRA